MAKGISGFSCGKCGYVEGEAEPASTTGADATDSGFNILSESDSTVTLPTIKIDCEKCSHNEAVWWMLQTRGADEPTTQFYRCVKCSHTWRNYS